MVHTRLKLTVGGTGTMETFFRNAGFWGRAGNSYLTIFRPLIILSETVYMSELDKTRDVLANGGDKIQFY